MVLLLIFDLVLVFAALVLVVASTPCHDEYMVLGHTRGKGLGVVGVEWMDGGDGRGRRGSITLTPPINRQIGSRGSQG